MAILENMNIPYIDLDGSALNIPGLIRSGCTKTATTLSTKIALTTNNVSFSGSTSVKIEDCVQYLVVIDKTDKTGELTKTIINDYNELLNKPIIRKDLSAGTVVKCDVDMEGGGGTAVNFIVTKIDGSSQLIQVEPGRTATIEKFTLQCLANEDGSLKYNLYVTAGLLGYIVWNNVVYNPGDAIYTNKTDSAYIRTGCK